VNIYAAIVVCVFLCVSCGGRSVQGPSPQTYQGGGSYNNSKNRGAYGDEEINSLNSELIRDAGSATSGSPDTYTIGPSDLLEIKAIESDKFTTTERVDMNGNVNLPFLDDVNVSNLTPIQAEEKIEDLLREEGFIKNPHVDVFVAEHKSKSVSVLGFVNEPGNYEMFGDMTLLDALAMAKGLGEGAGTIAYITRTENGTQSKIMVDLDDLLKMEDTPGQGNLQLRAGDKVYVPEASNVFVDGAVRTPGSYPINEGETTLSQAIVMAGGVASYADEGDINLVRYTGNGKREVINVDLESIEEGAAEDPLLNEKDAIVVGASGFKSFFYGLNFNVFGLGGVGYNPPAR
jgi:polysaccharide export outer membrane protein